MRGVNDVIIIKKLASICNTMRSKAAILKVPQNTAAPVDMFHTDIVCSPPPS
jgi:hypothetical protein